MNNKASQYDIAKFLVDRNPNLTLSIYAPGPSNIINIVTPGGLDHLVGHLSYISDVFFDNGELNPKSMTAEVYAISLALDKKYDKSFELFNGIVSEGLEALPDESNTGKNILPSKNKFGALGFEGIYQFSKVAYHNRNKSKCKELLQMIADLPEKYEGGFRLKEVRLQASEQLVEKFGMNEYLPQLEMLKAKLFK